MAENDIYNNKQKYESFKESLSNFLLTPSERRKKTKYKIKYYCKNKANIKYFQVLFRHFEAKDNSYIRRMKVLRTFKLICFATEKDLKDCNRDEINAIMAEMHMHYKTPKSKSDFVKDTKYIWKILFPEKDEKGRIDENLVPYPVRHLSAKMDKSKEKMRSDRLTEKEFEDIIAFFSSDPRLQCFLTLGFESLARPQEMLYLKLRNIELHDNYAKLFITEHGKEGCGVLQCIDSYPYLIKWIEQHPLKKKPDSFLFISVDPSRFGKQITPAAVNKWLKIACKALKIDKRISCYSFKRNGVTFRRRRGESDLEIQHAARWTSTRQLKTYDLSNQEDAFQLALERKGILPKKNTKVQLGVRKCRFCNSKAGFTDEFCPKCKRPLDREKIKELEKDQAETIIGLKEELEQMKAQIALRKPFEQEMSQLLQNPQVSQIYTMMQKMQMELDQLKQKA